MPVTISNANTLTSGVQVLNGTMVGLVLLPDEYGQIRHKERIFQVENRISQVLVSYLLYMVLLNLLYAAVIFLVNLVLTLYACPHPAPPLRSGRTSLSTRTARW